MHTLKIKKIIPIFLLAILISSNSNALSINFGKLKYPLTTFVSGLATIYLSNVIKNANTLVYYKPKESSHDRDIKFYNIKIGIAASISSIFTSCVMLYNLYQLKNQLLPK